MRASNKINGRRLILVLVLMMTIVGFVRRSVGTFAVVTGSSMYPTFKPDDVVQARSGFEDVHRGDVVILTDNRGDKVIKRVLGLPGETLTVYRGFVYIGRHRLHEPYLARRTYTFNSDPLNERAVVWHLKPDQYFVLGDNRLESCDSRHYGPVKAGQINQLVTLPENAMGPDFSEIVLSKTGKALPVKSGQPPTGRNRFSSTPASLNAKI